MAEPRIVAVIATSCSDPSWHRAMCRLCPWASDVAGTTHDLAHLAAVAHAEAAHNARGIYSEPAFGRGES